VLEVVANRCCENGQVLISIKIHLFAQVTVFQNHIYSLAQISGVSLIMVSNIFVTLLNCRIEIKQLIYIDFRLNENTSLCYDIGMDCLKFSPIRKLTQVEYVEILRIALS
jgi:hypothetical protein